MEHAFKVELKSPIMGKKFPPKFTGTKQIQLVYGFPFGLDTYTGYYFG